MSNVKTMDELEQEWGLERYIPALGKATDFRLRFPDPVSVQDLRSFERNHPDAWEVYKAYMFHVAGQEIKKALK